MQPFKEITSFRNPHVKAVIALREKKIRDQTQLMIVEGRREILRACESGIVFKEIYGSRAFFSRENINDLIPQSSLAAQDIFEVEEPIFEKMCFGHRNEGILAVCAQPHKTWEDLNVSPDSLIVVLVGVEKPGNVGAVLRTCDAAGVSAVVVCDAITDLYNPNTVRASLGAIFSVVTIEASSADALSFLKNKKIAICVTLLEAKVDYVEMNMRGPLAIVLGSEEKGLGPHWCQEADSLVRIPMKGKVDSLNVSVSAAVMIYEAIRQRR